MRGRQKLAMASVRLPSFTKGRTMCVGPSRPAHVVGHRLLNSMKIVQVLGLVAGSPTHQDSTRGDDVPASLGVKAWRSSLNVVPSQPPHTSPTLQGGVCKPASTRKGHLNGPETWQLSGTGSRYCERLTATTSCNSKRWIFGFFNFQVKQRLLLAEPFESLPNP